MTGSSDTDVVFSEVDLNHNVATIHCFLFFIIEAFCLLALNKHVLFEVLKSYFTTNSLTVVLVTIDWILNHIQYCT